jgi:3-hydroxyisobutyrate dehydrogenase-like beta-hydroxyacid dehydrogenase
MDQKKQMVGLIGLGNAGLALAAPLLKQFAVVGYDRDSRRREIAKDAGLEIVASAKAVAAQCDIVLLSLPTPEASRAATSEMAGDELKGRLVIETSTVSPHDIEWLVNVASQHGATVVDSAIVGGVHKLADGQTTFLVGASDTDFARARPVLDAAAEEIFHLGPVGNGMRAKLVNNAVAHTTMVMIMEAAALAAKAGVPMDVFYKLMSRESGLMRPLTHRFGERIRSQDFDGGMSTANARKDSVLILDLARELGVPLFTMQASHTVYEIANNEDLSRLDYASISKLWEKWLGVHFGKEHDAQ